MASLSAAEAIPETRIRSWKNEEGYTHSKILASGLTYSQALALEKKAAAVRGCEQSGGGRYVAGRVWSVYHVWDGF